ncbi:MAG: TIGR04100 family radical SAM protein [Lachnospiraceae bacterium]|nr:TIGR04100 family radical SAM protein [Lachnospiraceae bacterium]MEE3460504.1 TIGR04100 family radical SAM protein [Lachnospiraceae bacterium]
MTERKEEILYKVHNGLYVNMTNRCPCACTFCLRQNMDKIGESDVLWLDHEPSVEEVEDAFRNKDMSEFDEVVFCGFGEPTERFDDLIRVAAFVKENYQKKVRINTNGLGCLINDRDICPDMKGLIDTLSISLNTPDKEEYLKLVRPKFGDRSFEAMLDFAREAKKYVPEVVLTTVDTTISKEDEKKCDEICRSLGVRYRIRAWEG